MEKGPIVIILFFIIFGILIPFTVWKYNIKDNIKFVGGHPVGTAKFRAFLKLTVWVIAIALALSLALNALEWFGVNL